MTLLRHYQFTDAAALLHLFRDTVRRVNVCDYSPEQIAAWASEDIDLADWATRFEGRFVLVAEQEGQLAGFAELTPQGHIDRFYVAANCQRQGVGQQLLSAIVAEARRLKLSQLHVAASTTARPFFAAHGFQVLSPQQVTCRGIQLTNFCMVLDLEKSKNLTDAADGTAKDH
jgi:putative acetyltransferase